jgi:hypothetical protein
MSPRAAPLAFHPTRDTTHGTAKPLPRWLGGGTVLRCTKATAA